MSEIHDQSSAGSEGLRETLPITLDSVHHRWAISWHNRKGRWISTWAHLLKGKRHEKAWKALADHYALHEGQAFLEDAVLLSPKPLIFLGPEQSDDHSYFWGKYLAENFGARHLPFIFIKPEGEQKGQRLDERRQKTLILRDGYKNFIQREKNDWHWIFADDVWTSGSTANAAYVALQKPRNFQVLSFFRRFS